MRLIEPMMAPRIVRTEHSMASIFLGVGSEAESWLFTMGAKDGIGKFVLWSLWYVGMVIGALVLAHVIPDVWGFGCFLALPLPIVAFLLLSIDLVMEVLHEVEFYVILLLQFVLVVHTVMALIPVTLEKRWWHNKLLPVICYMPSMLVMGFCDAYPARYRAIFQILYSTGAIAVLVLWNSMITVEHGTWHHHLYQIGDNLTLMLFYCRHLYTAMVYPEAYVLISSMVRTKREKVKLEFGQNDEIALHRADSCLTATVNQPRGAPLKSTTFLESLP